jgi:hypothetical protein
VRVDADPAGLKPAPVGVAMLELRAHRRPSGHVDRRPPVMTARIPTVIKGSNAHLIATIAPLYIMPTDVVPDPTYGEGKWWTDYRPEHLICHDLALDGVDFRHLPPRPFPIGLMTRPAGWPALGAFPGPVEPSRWGGKPSTVVRDRDWCDVTKVRVDRVWKTGSKVPIAPTWTGGPRC